MPAVDIGIIVASSGSVRQRTQSLNISCGAIGVQAVKRKHHAFTFSMPPILRKKTSIPSLTDTKRPAWTATSFIYGTWKLTRNSGKGPPGHRSQPTSG